MVIESQQASRVSDTVVPTVRRIGDVTIDCMFCHHRDSLDRFCESPIFGPLPRNTFQCPSCHRAFRKTYGTPKVYPDGFIMPGEVTMVEVESVL